MRRRVGSLLLCCLLTAGCTKFVRVEVASVEARPIETPQQTIVYAADGSQIATLRYANRDNVDYTDLPQHLVDAVVAAEDRRFYEHAGVDARAIARAAVANQKAGRVVQGGSTITQQLVKNRYFPHAEESFERKADEAILAMELERQHTKEEILLDYLNTVYFGAGAYGIQAAAQTYFGVDTGDLSLPQSVLLAGLIRSPESASPHRAPERAGEERARVLDAMVATGALEPRTATIVDALPLGVQPLPPPPATRYPHFVEHVKRTLIADPMLGRDEASRVRRLFGGGLRIHTTIDPKLQAQAEAAARQFLSDPGDPEVGMAVVDHRNGHVVAAVGGRDFATSQFDLATQARRQPGSTFKTVALVAALRDGMRLEDSIASGSFVHSRGPHADPWRVRSGTAGLLSLRSALAKSSNGAFARLGLHLGPGRIAQQARAMGITADLGANEAMVLGGLREGVSPLHMATAYGSIANGGVLVPTLPYTKITDARGEVVYEPVRPQHIAMDGATAWEAIDALRSVIEEGTGKAADIGRPAAGKTGTSQEYRDAWFVGFTPHLTTAVWVGYPDAERPMLDVKGVRRVEGGTYPAWIWRDFMLAAHAGLPVEEFTYPQHLEVTVLVDPESGGLANQWCPFTVEVTALPADLPDYVCELHGPPPSPTPEPTGTPTPEPTATPTPTPTSTPTPEPTRQPTPERPPPPPPTKAPAEPSPPAEPNPPAEPSPPAEPPAEPTPSPEPTPAQAQE